MRTRIASRNVGRLHLHLRGQGALGRKAVADAQVADDDAVGDLLDGLLERAPRADGLEDWHPLSMAFRSTEVMQIVAVLQLAARFYEQKQLIVSDNEGGQANGVKLRRRPSPCVNSAKRNSQTPVTPELRTLTTEPARNAATRPTLACRKLRQ